MHPPPFQTSLRIILSALDLMADKHFPALLTWERCPSLEERDDAGDSHSFPAAVLCAYAIVEFIVRHAPGARCERNPAFLVANMERLA